MLAAIENSALNDNKSLLDAVGMTGEPTEIESFSLVRALWKQSDTTLAIVDIGGKTSKLYIVRGGTLVRIHRVAIGGSLITKRVSDLLHITPSEAEDLKRNCRENTEECRDIHKAMASVIDGPLKEFRRFMSMYETRYGEKIARVVCAGGVSAAPTFKPYARDQLSREIEIANPFDKVAYPAFMEDTLTAIGPTFSVSVGAALREFLY